MIDARLQYGPYDGQSGHVRTTPLPLALDVTACTGCGCGCPLHYQVADLDRPARNGYARYELIEVSDVALYRHADTLDPATERTIAEALTA